VTGAIIADLPSNCLVLDTVSVLKKLKLWQKEPNSHKLEHKHLTPSPKTNLGSKKTNDTQTRQVCLMS
jgi:hypothetical protein